MCIAQENVTGFTYKVPDSIKAIGYIVDIKINNTINKITTQPGIFIDGNRVGLFSKNDKRGVSFTISSREQLNPKYKKFDYAFDDNVTYKLLFLSTSDSATKKSISSFYVFLAKENKWKLLQAQMSNTLVTINQVGDLRDELNACIISNRWLLRSNNTWKALDTANTKPPVLRPMSNIDSVAQQQTEEAVLRKVLPKDSVVYDSGIFYQILKEGSGTQVIVTDTVKIYYKGWLFSNKQVFDETKPDTPATFPLSRLIRGWQVGVPHCKVGGKIRLYIPSGSAYGIRTFATDIPPNSTLVFDVEVLEAKTRQ
jgi:FKBP-type peptidyl-prolyl cis-trans isomerase FkpA